ncbi:unnamed protein product [Fusarium graminearum]|uniref:Uncharacterized protein n=1 Tax=Gibberella zeae TaxID=5518 RepID=A0A4E9DTV8_GIBZA|nr:unnamed protein product [Fusarium graminearum]CAF3531266.1 unnamed protein product [Fusarium graminearum]CAG1966119.1 unnamed protein product [Fusarium graminearum]CAG2012337.1 unnamed protein product [Fusarium graminearum]
MRNKRSILIGGTDWHEADSRKRQTHQDDVKFPRMRRDKMKDGLMRRRRDRELTVSQKMQREVNKSRRLRGRRDEAGAPVIRENLQLSPFARSLDPELQCKQMIYNATCVGTLSGNKLGRTLLEGQQQDLMYRPWAVIVVQPNNER